MRNHFFLLLVLASLFAFVQKFAEGELSLFPNREPAQSMEQEFTVSVETGENKNRN